MNVPEIILPSSLLRSAGIVLIGSVSPANLVVSITEVLQMETEKSFNINVETVPLAKVETYWNRKTKKRLVFTI